MASLILRFYLSGTSAANVMNRMSSESQGNSTLATQAVNTSLCHQFRGELTPDYWLLANRPTLEILRLTVFSTFKKKVLGSFMPQS